VKGARYALSFRERLVLCDFVGRANDLLPHLPTADQVPVARTLPPTHTPRTCMHVVTQTGLWTPAHTRTQPPTCTHRHKHGHARAPTYTHTRRQVTHSHTCAPTQLQLLAVSATLYRKAELFRRMAFALHVAAAALAAAGHVTGARGVARALVGWCDGSLALASEPSYAALVARASATEPADAGPALSAATAIAAAEGAGQGQGHVPGLPGNTAVSAKETVLRAWPRLQISLLTELIRLCDQLDGTHTSGSSPTHTRTHTHTHTHTHTPTHPHTHTHKVARMCDQTDGTLPLHGCCYSFVCVFVDLSVCVRLTHCALPSIPLLSLCLCQTRPRVCTTRRRCCVATTRTYLPRSRLVFWPA
jgi:hypothetical protein